MYWYTESAIWTPWRLLDCTEMTETKDGLNNYQEWQFLVLSVSLVMRFVVQYFHDERVRSQSDCEKVNNLLSFEWLLASCWVEILRSLSIDPSSCDSETMMTQHHHQRILQNSFFSSMGGGGSAASQYRQQPGLLLDLDENWPVHSWLDHPWLPQDDKLSYRESLRDSGVSRTWGRLGERASSGRSLRSSSPASRLISGTLGVRVFPLRLTPVWTGTGRLPGSTTRLEEGPPAFKLWKEAWKYLRSRVSSYVK